MSNLTLTKGAFNQSIVHDQALQRDNYECKRCGSKERLTVHHIKPWHQCRGPYLHLRYDIDNLVTLCHECHNKQEQQQKRSKSTCRFLL